MLGVRVRSRGRLENQTLIRPSDLVQRSLYLNATVDLGKDIELHEIHAALFFA